jgi:hypothetical protein
VTKPARPSSLLEAAQAFDDALANYARLGELFVKAPLSTPKHLERAGELLGEIAACEEKLAVTGKYLVAALGEARARQERHAAEVVERMPALKARNDQLAELYRELAALGAETSALNPGNGDPAKASADVARDLGDKVAVLAGRAEKLALAAREAEFDELATQAHALHQKLLAASKKLHEAGLSE